MFHKLVIHLQEAAKTELNEVYVYGKLQWVSKKLRKITHLATFFEICIYSKD